MELTVPHPYLDNEFIGYVLNTPFSKEGQQKIIELQQKFKKQFGEAVYLSEPETLHITLMDWLAPLVDYGRGKDEIFPEIFESYDKALEEALAGISSIDVNFEFIGVSPEAVIIRGTDQGQYQKIREAFLKRVELLPNTKMPPRIIHSTIARFSRAVELQPIKDFAQEQSINFQHTTEFFRLLRATDTKMEAKKVIKIYGLK